MQAQFNNHMQTQLAQTTILQALLEKFQLTDFAQTQERNLVGFMKTMLVKRLESSKFAAKLAGHQELLRKNQMLVRLKTELPEDFTDLEKTLSRQTPDWQKIASICREYSFNGILKDLPCPVQEPETPDVSTGSADGPEQLDLFAMPAQTVQAAPAEKKEPELPEQGTLF